MHFLNGIRILWVHVGHAAPLRGGVVIGLPADQHGGHGFEILSVAKHTHGLVIVMALRVGGIERGDGPQLGVHALGLADKPDHPVERPDVEAGRCRRIRTASATVKAARRPSLSRPPTSITMSWNLPISFSTWVRTSCPVGA